MQQLDLPMNSQPTEAPWPHAPAVLNQVYGFTDPTHGQEMVAMLKVTFLQHGTMLEALRRTAKQQDARIRELLADLAVREQSMADSSQRLDNLRDIRRREKRAELENELVLPGDSRFSTKGE